MNRQGHVFLVGFMGCGKSTVGRVLAQLLDRPFVDLDERIVERAGRSIPEIFQDSGERGFREMESRILLEETDPAQAPAVLATGGGTITVAANRRRMAEAGVSVWLHLPFAVLLERLGEEGRRQRPLFRSEGQARALYEARRADYGRADVQLAVEAGESPAAVAARIAAEIRGEQCGT